MRLSKNLSLKECTKSITAARLGMKNEPNEKEIANLREIAEHIFQPVRDHFGVPIYVSSGYRSPKLNRVIGGSVTSQHVRGQALDLDADVFGKISNADIFKYIKENLDFDQLIWEQGTDLSPAWVHVSYVSERENRRRVHKASRSEKGEVIYSIW
jgi:zinc D-Ala-D-Ala carboxypeptidase